MANLKIVLVGGGSFAWTPRLVSNILTNEHLNGSQVILYDLNPESLELTHALALKYREMGGSATTIERTTDRSVALDGAHAVVVTITTGGLRAMRHDLEIPEKYGVFQTVGDTTGPGGLVRALRNVPVFVDLARAMESLCPSAWLLNCSNPLAALTRAVARETSIRTLGVCHGVPGTARAIVSFLGADVGAPHYINTGIDHCPWFTEFRVGTQSVRDMLDEKGLEDWLDLPADRAAGDPVFAKLQGMRISLRIGRNLGVLPAIGDRHIVEFLPGYLTSPEVLKRHGLVRTTIEDREKRSVAQRERIQRLARGEEEVSLSRGGDEVDAWIAALHGGPAKEDNVSAPNVGQVPQLPMDAVVETRAVLDAAGCHPLASPMPPTVEALVRPHTIKDELIVEAAIEGNFEKALAALTLDPLVPDASQAEPLLEELIRASAEWLAPTGLWGF